VKTPAGDEIAYDVAGGFLSVTNDGVTVLAESAEPASGDDPAAVAALGSASADAH
jgi:F0F1-type ATP synthase epsilon subunit